MTDPQTPQPRRTSAARRDDGPDDSTPTKKTSTKKTAKASGLKLGAGPGVIDPKKIRDKVANWQTTGGGVIVAPDSTAGASSEAEPLTPLEPPSTTRSQPSTPRGTRDGVGTGVLEKEASRPKTATKPVKNVLDEDLKIASAPKKRVVSDSNWRKNKSPPKDGKGVEKPIGWVRSRPKPKPADELEEEPEVEKVVEEPRRRPRSEAVKVGLGAFTKPALNEVTVEYSDESSEDAPVDATPKKSPPRRRRPRHSPRTSMSAQDTPTRDGPTAHRRRSHDNDRPTSSPKEGSSEGTPVARRRRRRRSPVPSVEAIPAASVQSQEEAAKDYREARRRLRKRMPPQESRAKSADPAPPADASAPNVFPTRIEAWLTSTPDPFTEKKSRPRSRTSPRSTLSAPTASEVSSITNTESQVTSTTDCSQTTVTMTESDVTRSTDRSGTTITDSDVTRSTDRSRTTVTESDATSIATREDRRGRAKDIASRVSEAHAKGSRPAPLDTANLPDLSPSLSPRSLKRSGAVRGSTSPTKGRARPTSVISEETLEDRSVVSSAPSSSVEGSMFEQNHIPSRSKPGNLLQRRAFPTTGKRLSTIASVETFNTRAKQDTDSLVDSEVGSKAMMSLREKEARQDDGTGSTISRSRRSVRAKAVSHADLMSVLSLPRSKSKSLVSARSIRTNRTRLEDYTTESLFKELATDEEKYMRELNTLVDGVIPVLLACVLSRSDAAIAAGLFSKSAASQNNPNFTQPIVDMGIALERLKSLHRRIPTADMEALVTWAGQAEKIYADYIKSWRLGFQDVVVNLSPEADTKSDVSSKKSAWDEGLPRNDEGYVVNERGERVDVAFLLKRPLVRLKYLAKTFKGVQTLQPSEKAAKVSLTFTDLVNDARSRNDEERARLEDEAAASIDPTRARDPKSLKSLQGVSIDPNRCVRARDYFDMHLQHSSGQEIDCRVELLIRDDPPGKGSGADVLICDVDTANRWLFFPPVQLGRISARAGDSPGELVVMIRGTLAGGNEWKEVFSLKSSDEEAAPEWLEMLGDSPVPPPLAQISSAVSFTSKSSHMASSYGSSLVSTAYTTSTGYTTPTKSRTPSPRQHGTPVGEPAGVASKRWSGVPSPTHGTRVDRDSDKMMSGARVAERPSPTSKRHSLYEETIQEERASELSTTPTASGRPKPARYSRSTPSSPQTYPYDHLNASTKRSTVEKTASPQLAASSHSYKVWLPSDSGHGSESDHSDDDTELTPKKASRPAPHRRTSSVPSSNMPTMPRQRKEQADSSLSKSDSIRHHERSDSAPLPLRTKKSSGRKKSEEAEDQEASLTRSGTVIRKSKDESAPPAPPPHKTPPQAKALGVSVPVLSPFRNHRRTSSPLKHEYEPSTASDLSSFSESETSSESDNDYSASDSEKDSLEDDISPAPTPLSPVNEHETATTPPSTAASVLPEDTLGPSNSASQAPYREIPIKANIVYKGTASIFTWKEERNGLAQWEPLIPEASHIVVKPGFIEVFPLSSAASQPELSDDVRPLLALGLTPNVMVHRGTHIDIDIRSPPLSLSLLKAGGRTMFRSPFPHASEELWQAIRWSRENNPTFIALQNARGADANELSWAAQQDRNNARRPDRESGRLRWKLPASLSRSRSYRASSTRALSINSSVETKSSFFSALKLFSGEGSRFSSGRGSTYQMERNASTFAVNENDRDIGDMDAFSDLAGSTPGVPTPPIADGHAQGMPLGISNTKIRFHKLHGQRRWLDLGKARLHIMPALPSSIPSGAERLRSPSTVGEKRIVITTKSGDERLLDATIPENGFEMYGRVGIAVKVVEDILGRDGEVGVAERGGVGSKRLTVYMLQFKSVRECRYNYLMLGKMRY